MTAPKIPTLRLRTPVRLPSTDGVIRLRLPVAPSANRYWRIMRGRVVKSEAARQYQSIVQTIAKLARVVPLQGDITVSVLWYRARKAGDVDNKVKVILDALNGLCYQDDKQVRRLVIERVDGPEEAGMDVTIEPYGPRPAGNEGER